MPTIAIAADPQPQSPSVLRAQSVDPAMLEAVLGRLELRMARIGEAEPIPGCYWGEPEAGLRAGTLYYRDDTPLHSVLHEACHYACMSPARRRGLETDAGGSDLEESAVCYLQVLLASAVPGLGTQRMLEDMDAWGYSFRLGSAGRWFAEDAGDARAWLERHDLIDAAGAPTWRLRGAGCAEDT